MKKNIIMIIGIILIVIGILLQLNYNKQTNKENNEKNNNSEKVINYSCEKKSDLNDRLTVYTSYKFDYDGEIRNPIRKLIFKFSEYGAYSTAKIDVSGFDYEPDNFVDNEKKMTKEYTWNVIYYKKEVNQSIDEYLKQLESFEYTCTKES